MLGVSHSIQPCRGIPDSSTSQQEQIQTAYIWGQTRRDTTGIPGRTSLIAPLESMKQPKIITYVTATHWFNMLVLNLIY